jgi:hypothetical protein
MTTTVAPKGYKKWHVVRTVELGASAAEVWKLVGGFYTIHLWHPDITRTEVPKEQTETAAIRRLLTFPGQPKTTEELVSMNDEGCHYRYKWHADEWGERVQEYVADIRVFDLDMGQSSIMQWSSTFSYTEDALTQFYDNGFRKLRELFPMRPAKPRRPAQK